MPSHKRGKVGTSSDSVNYWSGTKPSGLTAAPPHSPKAKTHHHFWMQTAAYFPISASTLAYLLALSKPTT